MISKKEDWKDQLATLYKAHSKKQKDTKGLKSKFETQVNFKGRQGFSDSGVALTAKTLTTQKANRDRYANRKGRYHFTPLKRINDAAAELGKKYRSENPEHVKIVKEAVKIAQEKIENISNLVTTPKIKHTGYKQDRGYAPTPIRSYNYYGYDADNDSIEVTPAPIERKTTYKNKVWEEVARLKKQYKK